MESKLSKRVLLYSVVLFSLLITPEVSAKGGGRSSRGGGSRRTSSWGGGRTGGSPRGWSISSLWNSMFQSKPQATPPVKHAAVASLSYAGYNKASVPIKEKSGPNKPQQKTFVPKPSAPELPKASAPSSNQGANKPIGWDVHSPHEPAGSALTKSNVLPVGSAAPGYIYKPSAASAPELPKASGPTSNGGVNKQIGWNANAPHAAPGQAGLGQPGQNPPPYSQVDHGVAPPTYNSAIGAPNVGNVPAHPPSYNQAVNSPVGLGNSQPGQGSPPSYGSVYPHKMEPAGTAYSGQNAFGHSYPGSSTPRPVGSGYASSYPINNQPGFPSINNQPSYQPNNVGYIPNNQGINMVGYGPGYSGLGVPNYPAVGGGYSQGRVGTGDLLTGLALLNMGRSHDTHHYNHVNIYDKRTSTSSTTTATTTIASSTVPSSTVPSSTVPSTLVPSSTVPSTLVPSSTASLSSDASTTVSNNCIVVVSSTAAVNKTETTSVSPNCVTTKSTSISGSSTSSGSTTLRSTDFATVDCPPATDARTTSPTSVKSTESTTSRNVDFTTVGNNGIETSTIPPNCVPKVPAPAVSLESTSPRTTRNTDTTAGSNTEKQNHLWEALVLQLNNMYHTSNFYYNPDKNKYEFIG